jgi:hypothetical protein
MVQYKVIGYGLSVVVVGWLVGDGGWGWLVGWSGCLELVG